MQIENSTTSKEGLDRMLRHSQQINIPFMDLIEQLRESYDVQLQHPVYPGAGTTNTVVLFDDFVLRLHSPLQSYRSPEYIEVEVSILEALAQQGLRCCPAVVRTVEGEALFYWHYGEMNGHAILLTRCQGISKPPNAARSFIVAKTLGKLHAALMGDAAFSEDERQSVLDIKSQKEPSIPRDIVARGRQIAALLRDRQPFGPNDTERLAQLLCDLCDDGDKEAHAHNDVAWGVVHLDLNATNFLWDEGDENCSLVDWDFAQPGPLLMDVAFALIEWCVEREDTKHFGPNIQWDAECASQFLQCYNSERPFLANELTHLPAYFGVCWARSLSWLCEPSHWSHAELSTYAIKLMPVLEEARDVLSGKYA